MFGRANPYLSIVITTRDDDHGVNPMHRLGIFFEHLLEQGARHALPAELVIVEWSPLKGRKRLTELLKKPEGTEALPVRIIEVPEEVHNSLRNSERMGIFEFYAKNIGIRRAHGKFILSTNNDLLFTEELIQFLNRRELNENCFYRVDRYNLSVSELPNLAPAQLMKYCNFKTRSISGQYGNRKPDGMQPPDDNKTIHVHACGDFTLMSHSCLLKLGVKLMGIHKFPCTGCIATA